MFDPYRKWLGILPKDQPPNHYRLLGVELFEDDLDVIEGAADRQMAFVRQYQSGEHASAAAKILNEVAAARLCLLKPATKVAYDKKLRQQQSTVASASEPENDELSFLNDLPSRDKSKKSKSTRTKPADSQWPLYLVMGGSIAVIAFVAVVFLRPQPKSPPTKSATIAEKEAARLPAAEATPRLTEAPNADAVADTKATRSAMEEKPEASSLSQNRNLQPGLIRLVFEGMSLEKQIHAQIDPQIQTNFDVGGAALGLPVDGFSIRWSGVLRIPETAKYTFQFDHDDGERLWIDEKQLVDNWNGGVHHDSIEVDLEKGDHAIKVEYFEANYTAGINLWWKSPTIPLVIIPTTALFHDSALAAKLGVDPALK